MKRIIFLTAIYKTRIKILFLSFSPFITIEESYLQTFFHSLKMRGEMYHAYLLLYQKNLHRLLRYV